MTHNFKKISRITSRPRKMDSFAAKIWRLTRSLKMRATLSRIQPLTKRKSELVCKQDQQLLRQLFKPHKRMVKRKIACIMLSLGRESPSLRLIIISALQIEMISMIKRMKSRSATIFRIIEKTFKEALLMDKMG